MVVYFAYGRRNAQRIRAQRVIQRSAPEERLAS